MGNKRRRKRFISRSFSEAEGQLSRDDEIFSLSDDEVRRLHLKNLIRFGQCIITLQILTQHLMNKKIIAGSESVGDLRQFLIVNGDMLVDVWEVSPEHIHTAMNGVAWILEANTKGIRADSTCSELLVHIDEELRTIPDLIERMEEFYNNPAQRKD